ncbi:serine threonine protein kinase CMGC group [Sporothrix curviconia]|uniref:Serine threonine protein kinase CMGC group n=1 Tax=Sporothrix curviconia TaxID=1260050 RepID=A0ABP0BEB6_9PEZI
MSTPTTATATLPHYAAGYPFSHNSSYRPTHPGPSSRLAPPQVSSPSSASYVPYSPSSAHLVPAAVANGAAVAANHANHARQPQPQHHQQQPASQSQHYHHTIHNNHGHAPPATHNGHSQQQHLHPHSQHDSALSSPSYSATTTITLPPPSRLSHGTVAASTPSTATFDASSSMHAAMSSQQTHSSGGGDSMPPRKRRRSGPPDWGTFYKNGLPQEVIVIEDSPESEAPNGRLRASDAGYNGAVAHNGARKNGAGGVDVAAVAYNYNQKEHLANGGAAAAAAGGDRHIAKKRRRQDEPLPPANSLVVNTSGSRYDPVHNYVQHHSSGSTISSERTNSNSNSSLYTTTATAANTATTSLVSSNGQYDYDTASQKRKRTTRQQVANETKKRDREVAALGLAFANYRPPPLPPVKAAEVDVKVIRDAPYSKGIKVDDEDGHYIVVPETDLTKKYQMVKLLGQGTFGKVVQARDREKNELVAIKIIRSVQKYRDASRIELRVLETLKANDRENRNRCIHLRECFDFRGHICIVMDLLGQSVFDFLKGNGFVPFPNSQIQSFARQLFTSVAFLHDLQLIHTDLKPENILLVDANYQTFTYNRKIPSSSTTVGRQATQRRVLLDTEIRLIDFGSATFQDEYHSSVVSTRHYRAPEIILGLGWSFPCDIWSIGCILVEFFTGDALFQTHDNLEHLAMMEAVCDGRIDSHLVQQVVKSTRNGGNPASKYFKRLRLDYPSEDTTRASRRFVKAMKKLNDIIPVSSSFLRQFLDLLKRIFIYDPSQRITAKEALQHPWFREVAVQDDGTEAAKIRHQRERASRERTTSRAAQLH